MCNCGQLCGQSERLLKASAFQPSIFVLEINEVRTWKLEEGIKYISKLYAKFIFLLICSYKIHVWIWLWDWDYSIMAI